MMGGLEYRMKRATPCADPAPAQAALAAPSQTAAMGAGLLAPKVDDSLPWHSPPPRPRPSFFPPVSPAGLELFWH